MRWGGEKEEIDYVNVGGNNGAKEKKSFKFTLHLISK